MTLIIGATTPTETIVVSDRRLTRNGQLYEDESNKATVFVCTDGRAVIAFTGLAELTPTGRPLPPIPPPQGSFATRWWILDALLEAARPDQLMLATVARFCSIAT